MAALLADDTFDAVLPILVPQALVDPGGRGRGHRPGVASCPRQTGGACFMGDEAVRQPMAVLHEHHIALYQFPEQAARALGAMWRYAEGRVEERRERREKGNVENCRAGQRAGAFGWLISLPPGRTHLGEAEARPVLAAYGIDQPRGGAGADSAEEAGRMAAEIGFPVALKIVSPDIFHKSEVGGIALKLGDAERSAAPRSTTMLARVQQRQPERADRGRAGDADGAARPRADRRACAATRSSARC